jgi:hypothetical protein
MEIIISKFLYLLSHPISHAGTSSSASYSRTPLACIMTRV